MFTYFFLPLTLFLCHIHFIFVSYSKFPILHSCHPPHTSHKTLLFDASAAIYLNCTGKAKRFKSICDHLLKIKAITTRLKEFSILKDTWWHVIHLKIHEKYFNNFSLWLNLLSNIESCRKFARKSLELNFLATWLGVSRLGISLAWLQFHICR